MYEGSECRLEIWDQTGSVVVGATNGLFYRDTAAALICFSLTDRETFMSAKKWSQELDNNCGTDKQIVKYLVGLQQDREVDDSVDFLEVTEFLQEHRFKQYF